jgi:uncharacterized protein (TIGR02231 family)
MKISRLPALSLLLVAGLHAAVDSRITAVTVYTDRAVVTRSTAANFTAAGTHELVFEKLPASLNEQSLQVSGRGTAAATILDVSAKQTYLDFTPNERVKTLEDQLKALGKQMRGLDDRGRLLEQQKQSVDRIEAAVITPAAKDVPRADLNQFTATLTFVSEQRAKLAADRAALDEQREELEAKINAAQQQLNELRGAGGRAFKTVTVRVSAANPGSLDLALSYTVPGASWWPSYDARVLHAERAVELGYFGLVHQNTGEDWKDVALTLSTARPGLGGAAPQIYAWNLDVLNPVLLREQAARSEMERRDRNMMAKSAMNAPRAVNMQTLTSDAAGAVAEEKEAEAAVATIETGATSAVFKLAAAASVPSDNSPQKVPVMSTQFKAAPEYLTVPKLQQNAFLTAKVANSSDFPLLAGAMNVFLDGTFVATSKLRTVMPGEKFDLALGADEGIGVKHKRVQKFTEDTGLTNSGKRITYEYLLTIQNNKKTAERVIVTDQVPLSRNEKIVIRQLTPSAGELKPTDEGVLKWTLDLKPGEKRELTVKFTVEHPNDVQVTGLE